MPTTQVSAHLSEETKARLDRFVRRTRARVIEDALLQHLQALEELPAEAIVLARIVLSASSAERVREMIARPPEPTKEMKRLFDAVEIRALERTDDRQAFLSGDEALDDSARELGLGKALLPVRHRDRREEDDGARMRRCGRRCQKWGGKDSTSGVGSCHWMCSTERLRNDPSPSRCSSHSVLSRDQDEGGVTGRLASHVSHPPFDSHFPIDIVRSQPCVWPWTGQRGV